MDTKSIPHDFPLRFSIIGAGKVAKSIADKLQELALLDFVVYHNTARKIELIEFGIHSNLITNDYTKISSSDIIIISVTDQAIDEVVHYILNNLGNNIKNKFIFHTSGLISAKVLNPLIGKGANVFSAHPVQTFFFSNKSLLNNISWGIETINTDKSDISSIIALLGGYPIFLPDNLLENRELYHLICVITSNFVTTTIEFAKLISNYLNIDKLEFLSELIKTTTDNCIRNINTLDTPLTGPLARKDFIAIENYLQKISVNEPLKDILKNYLMANIELMKEKNFYNDNEFQQMIQILNKY